MEVSHNCIIKEAELCICYDEKIIPHTKYRYIKNSLFCTLSFTDIWYNFLGLINNHAQSFLIKKIIITIMLRLGPSTSCRGGFKTLDILTLPSLYIFALTMLVVRKPDHFET